jgi:hypothetical protein
MSKRSTIDTLSEEDRSLDPWPWQWSSTGNLVRGHRGVCMTVFPNRRGPGYCWSIRHGDGSVRYSKQSFTTQGDAMQDVWLLVLHLTSSDPYYPLPGENDTPE